MAERTQPVVQTTRAADAKQEWDTLLDQVRRYEKRSRVESKGEAIAGIVSAA